MEQPLKRTPDFIAAVVTAYQDELQTTADIARAMGCTPSTVVKALKQAGVVLRTTKVFRIDPVTAHLRRVARRPAVREGHRVCWGCTIILDPAECSWDETGLCDECLKVATWLGEQLSLDPHAAMREWLARTAERDRD